MVGKPNLTQTSISQLETYPGQAHFAVGPRTCRECEHWANQKGERDRRRLLKPARCMKAALLSPGRLPEAPHQAKACKYFQAAPHPPPI